MVHRAHHRSAFGSSLAEKDTIRQAVAEARIEITKCRRYDNCVFHNIEVLDHASITDVTNETCLCVDVIVQRFINVMWGCRSNLFRVAFATSQRSWLIKWVSKPLVNTSR